MPERVVLWLVSRQADQSKVRSRPLPRAALIDAEGVHETLAYMAFPREHRSRIRTNNIHEREMWRRTRVAGNFLDGKSALVLVGAQLRHVAGTRWGT